MALVTIQVSNHPRAGEQPAPEAAAISWQTIYDGELTEKEAARAVEELAGAWYRHARAFAGHHGAALGRLLCQKDGRLDPRRAPDSHRCKHGRAIAPHQLAREACGDCAENDGATMQAEAVGR